jgi:hypothetical protein
MGEFYTRRVAPDRCRVEVTIDGRQFSQDLLVEDLDEKVLHFEEGLGHSPERIALLRGTVQGFQLVMREVREFARRGMTYEVLMAVLWGLAHGPTPRGWKALEGLGGHIVTARLVPGRVGFDIHIFRPGRAI